MDTFWHQFQCDESDCKKDETGLFMAVRTGTTKRPGRVRCPHCGRAPTYRGFGSKPDETKREGNVVQTLRLMSPTEIHRALEAAKVIEGWTEYHNGTHCTLFALGDPFHAIGTVCFVHGEWVAYMGRTLPQNRIGQFPDTISAKKALEEKLCSELGYKVA